jgi:hypothetical protein
MVIMQHKESNIPEPHMRDLGPYDEPDDCEHNKVRLIGSHLHADGGYTLWIKCDVCGATKEVIKNIWDDKDCLDDWSEPE